MPANYRQHVKREIERASNNLDMALAHLAPLSEEYRTHHPDISEAFELAAMGIIQSQELMAKIRESI